MPTLKQRRERFAEKVRRGELIPTVRTDFILSNGEEAFYATPVRRESITLLKRVVRRIRNLF